MRGMGIPPGDKNFSSTQSRSPIDFPETDGRVAFPDSHRTRRLPQRQSRWQQHSDGGRKQQPAVHRRREILVQSHTCEGSQAMSLTPLPVSPSLMVPMGCVCDMLNTFPTPVLELQDWRNGTFRSNRWKGEFFSATMVMA